MTKYTAYVKYLIVGRSTVIYLIYHATFYYIGNMSSVQGLLFPSANSQI